MADAAAPTRRSAVQREIRRRERTTRMGPGGGADLVDNSVVPFLLEVMIPDPLEVTRTFRYLDRMVPDADTRVELLHLILGE